MEFLQAQAKFALLLGDTKQLPPRAVYPGCNKGFVGLMTLMAPMKKAVGFDLIFVPRHPPLQRSALARLSAESSTTLELRTQYRFGFVLEGLKV